MDATTTNSKAVIRLLRLIQLADSTLPVGGFSFSLGLETAVGEGIVRDAASLEAYLHTMLEQTAFSDGVAALAAHRAIRQGRLTAAFEADRSLWQSKAGDENRRMSQRMGHKLADLGRLILSDEVVQQWAGAVKREQIAGCYATTQGVLFAVAGLNEEALFVAELYGVASQIVSAALRTMRLDHLSAQQILFRQASLVEHLFGEVQPLSPEEMHRFCPEADLLASLHEWGERRLFMN